jgi:hypothetical protein
MSHHRDDDLEREIQTHLELEAEERVGEGVPFARRTCGPSWL